MLNLLIHEPCRANDVTINISILNEAIVLFKFRTRMAPFADNFKAGKVSSMCPLCFPHIDSQEGSFACVTLNKLVNIRGKYSDIFENQVPEEVVKSIHSIYMLRKDVKEQ